MSEANFQLWSAVIMMVSMLIPLLTFIFIAHIIVKAVKRLIRAIRF